MTEVLAVLGLPAAWMLTATRTTLGQLGWTAASWTAALVAAAVLARIITVPLWMAALAGRRNEAASWPIVCGVRASEEYSSRAAEAELARLARHRPPRTGVRAAARLVPAVLVASLTFLFTGIYFGTDAGDLAAIVRAPASPVALTSSGWQLLGGDGSPVRVLLGGVACGLIWWAAVTWQDRQTRTRSLPAWVLAWDPASRRVWPSLVAVLAASLFVLPFGAVLFAAVWQIAGSGLLPLVLRPAGPPPEITERYLRYDERTGVPVLRIRTHKSAPRNADTARRRDVDTPTEELPVVDAPTAEDPQGPAAVESPLRMPPRTSPLTPEDPRRIGGYELRKRLGAGGMGTVYVARDPWANTDVALKTVSAGIGGSAKDLARFQREADTLAVIDNAFTVRILGSGIDRQRPYMVMELLDGMTLDDYVYEVGPITDPEVLHAVGSALALSLAALHRSGMVHRDIKPSNLMLTSSGPKLIDFGIVHMPNATRLTRTGTHLGTMAYMAPEQFRGADVSPAADVWAWGCCLVIAATGHGPFDAPDIAGITRKILMDPPDEELVDYVDRLDPAFGALVRSTLDKNPVARPGNGGDLLARLCGGRIDPPAVTAHVHRVWRRVV